MTTFVVTFFVGHAHSFWRKCYTLSRVVQGRLNDVGLLCATHAPDAKWRIDARIAPVPQRHGERVAPLPRALLVGCLLSAQRRLGLHTRPALGPRLGPTLGAWLTHPEGHATLLAADLPPSRWYLVVLEWLTSRVVQARREGTLVGGEGFEMASLTKICELRAACMGIPDELAARMPLAYVHFTHLLVDALLFLAPFALYARLGAFSVILNAFIALFYRCV